MNSPQRFKETDRAPEQETRKETGEKQLADVGVGGDLFDEFATDMAARGIGTAGRRLNQPEEEGPDQAAAREFRKNREDAAAGTDKMVWGWSALTAAIVSLFFLPQIFAPVSVIIGVVAYFRGGRTMGVWSVVIGLISLIAYLFLVPYYA